jgi:hypothetical protein
MISQTVSALVSPGDKVPIHSSFVLLFFFGATLV